MANLNYQPTTWVNNQDPPISADNLNHIEQGIKTTADRVDELVTVEANPSETPTATMESLEVDGTVYKVGGGHAVKDSSGNTMTQRENLQFTDAHTSDDNQGNTTKVEIAKQVTSQEWEDATEKGFYLIGDDDDYLLDISQVANADAEHLPYSSTQSTKQKIDDVESKTQKQVYTLKWTANSTSSAETHFTESKTIPKGKYLAIGKGPVMTSEPYACNIHGVSGELTTFMFLSAQKTESIIVEISGNSSEVYLESASSVANTFTYKERGGLWLVEL